MRVSRYVGLLLAVQLVAACSSEPERGRRSRQAEPQATAAGNTAEAANEKLVLAFGDSLYAGYGLEQDESFPAVLERQLDGAGHPGAGRQCRRLRRHHRRRPRSARLHARRPAAASPTW